MKVSTGAGGVPSYLTSNRYQLWIKSKNIFSRKKKNRFPVMNTNILIYRISCFSDKETPSNLVDPWGIKHTTNYPRIRNGECGNSGNLRPECNCIVASTDSSNPHFYINSCQTITNTKERYGICQYSECVAVDEQTGESKNCIFPFK